MASPSQVIILVEDQRHQQVVRRYLLRKGLGAHDLRFEATASGSGEQFVRERFPVEVGAYRNRNARAVTQLVVVIDADTLTVRQRLTQLDQQLLDRGVERIREDEPVARLVPRRNIESWILCLNELVVDEVTDFKRTYNDWTDLIGPAAENLYVWTRPNSVLPDNCIPSLENGVDELRKLD